MNISKRINAVMSEGNLTLSDMARWLGRPFATVRGWKRGRSMNGGTQDQEIILERLKLIEKRIRFEGDTEPAFWQADVWPDGKDYHAIGDTPHEALMRLAIFWKGRAERPLPEIPNDQ